MPSAETELPAATLTSPTTEPTTELVELGAGRPRLAVRSLAAPGRAFLLVHGLASNARLWDGVAGHLTGAGHRVLAVDLRGHGESEAPAGGYDTDTCADDVAVLIDRLGLTGGAAPIAVGQSWGGNVVLSLAARHPASVSGVACVDGGWIRLRDAFGSFDECWAALAPPDLSSMRYQDLAARIAAMHPDWPPAGVAGTLANLVETPGGGVRARLAREHHREIVRSLYLGDPAAWYPLVDVPALLVPAVGAEPDVGAEPNSAEASADRSARLRRAVRQALDALPRADVRWYPGADHDLHAQHPAELAADLLALAAQVSGSAAVSS